MDNNKATTMTTQEEHETKLTCDVLCSLSNARTEPAPVVKTTAAVSNATTTPTIAPPNQHPAPVPSAAPGVAVAVAKRQPPASARTTPPPSLGVAGFLYVADSLGQSQPAAAHSATNNTAASADVNNQRKVKPCPKQHQLPMFLSKTYHMIDRCNAEIATWAETGDSFVVKNVDKFSSEVLPMYFKHSNFSSFARQLNFYGFRKLRSDPILTNDVDPQTASYIRFYHSKFQKDRPDLLHQIKRATKSEQQSKDDVDGLKAEVCKLKECVQHLVGDMERKLADMSYEYNRRIANLSTEYDKLANLVTQLLHQHHQNGGAPIHPPPAPPVHHQPPPYHHHHAIVPGGPPSIVETPYLPGAAKAGLMAPVPAPPAPAPTSSFVTLTAQPPAAPPAAAAVAAAAHPPPAHAAATTEKMQSLSHAVVMRLEQQQNGVTPATAAANPPEQAPPVASTVTTNVGDKRPAPGPGDGPPPSTQPKQPKLFHE